MSSLTLYPVSLTHLALTCYGLYLCYQNITRLQQYEEKSEKAAQWSNTAAQKLYKTRTTQASGTITLTLSLLTSLFLIFSGPSSRSPFSLILCSLATSATLLASYTHMSAFWNEREQTQIPFVAQFNEAIKGSEQVVVLLATLGLGWGVAGLVWLGGMGSVVGLGIWGLVLGARVVLVAERMGWKV